MADPLPIIRTLCTTPQIARVFGLNGIVTLVDAKNAIRRLREIDEREMEREQAVDAVEAAAPAGSEPLPHDGDPSEIQPGSEPLPPDGDPSEIHPRSEPLPPDEAFQQIMFADRVVLSKVDLVDTATAIEVRSRMDLGRICRALMGTDGH